MRTIEEKGEFKTTVHRLFDSVDELVEFASDVPEERFAKHDNCHRASWVGRSFFGWSDVVSATRRAWPEGIEVLERMLRDLDDAELEQPRSRRRRPRFREDDGDELDYDRLRSGQAFWRTSRREFAKGPTTITVIVDVAANCGVSAKDILWRGAAAIALTKRLEEAGYRVELWAMTVTERVWSPKSKRPIDLSQSVCLKRPGDPIDESTLVSAVSGWFFRTVVFRSWCSGKKTIHRALGYHRAPKPADLDHVSRDANRIVIDGCFSYRDAVAKVRQAIGNLKTW